MINAYEQLDLRLQNWIFRQGWHNLREIQSLAIAPILSGTTDVLISAATAAGKTEAFFLPAISRILDQRLVDQGQGVGILYLSPLKALINDQDRRLESLADQLDLLVTPWHGDSAKSRKNKLRKKPSGVVLITPESLEALLINDAGWVKSAFAHLQYIAIDEFHAFLATERGYHLTSLLHRLENLLDRQCQPIPRVALSATLGDLAKIPALLRPNQSLPCEIIKNSQTKSTLKVQLKGYIQADKIEAPVDPLHPATPEGAAASATCQQREPASTSEEEDTAASQPLEQNAERKICEDLFTFCRGENHLVFANTRKRTESIAACLSDLCTEAGVPNAFFPHHGSLTKALREDLERRLQHSRYPTTAICTMTLELGIDIGQVQSVIQVTAPHSVSSLRQRIGRSGRRGNAAVLRMLITEAALTPKSHITDMLRLQLLQSLAMIRLIIANKWYEAADLAKCHFSTLLHQVLAVVAQWGGVRADQLFQLLCQQGPFNHIQAADFKQLLTDMGQRDLLVQVGSGELVLGVKGEHLTNHYSFYAVFNTPEEYRILNGIKPLGTLPLDFPILVDQHIIFAGKRWRVEEVDTEKKLIVVRRSKGGTAPKFGGTGVSVADRVRQEMYQILVAGDYRIAVGSPDAAQKIEFADPVAQQLFAESHQYFQQAALADTALLQQGNNVYILPWLGDKKINTIVALLNYQGFQAQAYAGVIEVEQAQLSQVSKVLDQLAQHIAVTAEQLAAVVEDKCSEKFDHLLPAALLCKDFAARCFDIAGAQQWMRQRPTGKPAYDSSVVRPQHVSL